MLKSTTPILILFLLPTLVFGQVSFTQYFDGSDTTASSINIIIDTTSTNIWQIGVPQKNIFNHAASVPRALLTDTIDTYPTNDTSKFSYHIDQHSFGYGILALQWKQKLDMDSGRDGGFIEFSIDSGTTWENAFSNPYVYNFYGYDQANHDTLPDGTEVFTGTDTNWRDIWLCFDLSWSTQNQLISIRHTFISDSIDNQKDGWMIDNMMAHVTFVHTVNENPSHKYLNVYPNPSSGRVNIEARKVAGYHLIEKMELLDFTGNVVETFGKSPTKFWIDLNHHPAGNYILKIHTNLHTKSINLNLE